MKKITTLFLAVGALALTLGANENFDKAQELYGSKKFEEA